MKKSTVAISLLAVALVVSNAWWAYITVDTGITHTYESVSFEETQQALSQALAIINVSSSPTVTRAQIIEASEKAWSAGEPFENDGYLWVGRLGLRFNKKGKLIEAIPG
jgi:hypothetical protein